MSAPLTPSAHIYEDLTGRRLLVTVDVEACAVRFDVDGQTALLAWPQACSLARGITEALNAWRDDISKGSP